MIGSFSDAEYEILSDSVLFDDVNTNDSENYTEVAIIRDNIQYTNVGIGIVIALLFWLFIFRGLK